MLPACASSWFISFTLTATVKLPIAIVLKLKASTYYKEHFTLVKEAGHYRKLLHVEYDRTLWSNRTGTMPVFCYDIVLTQGNQKTLFNKNIANTKVSFVPKL